MPPPATTASMKQGRNGKLAFLTPPLSMASWICAGLYALKVKMGGAGPGSVMKRLSAWVLRLAKVWLPGVEGLDDATYACSKSRKTNRATCACAAVAKQQVRGQSGFARLLVL